MPKTVDQQVTKLYWVPGDTGIAAVAAPTVAELNAGVDLTCLMVSTYEVGPQDSETTNERAVCEGSDSVAPTVQKYMGSLVLFRQFDATTGAPETDDPINTFEYKALGFFVRRLGKPYTTAWTIADEVEVYKFMADTPQPKGGQGEGYLKVTVPMLPQGSFDIKAVVA